MALGSTQLLTNEYLLDGKGGRSVGLTTVPPSCADCLEIWEPQPPGTPLALSRLVMGWFYPENRDNKCLFNKLHIFQGRHEIKAFGASGYLVVCS
jgi:hypothetical protein